MMVMRKVIYDRGAGGSTGPLEGITTENNAADAKAAVEFIRNQKKFGKVGVLGHSEGGTIALMLAGEGVLDFIISMAGVATPGKECIIWQNEALLMLPQLPQCRIIGWHGWLAMTRQNLSGR